MENLKIEGDFTNPSVDFNAQTGELTIEGNSVPEETPEYYEPIVKWLEDYLKAPCSNTIFNFKLNYFNSSTKKYILDILQALKRAIEDGRHITINWHYEEDDEDIQEAGEMYHQLIELPMNFIAVPVED